MEGKMMMKKYTKIGGLVGFGLLLLGLIIYSINAIMTTVSAVFMIAGAVLLVLYVVFNFSSIKEGLSSRSAKFGSNAALLILFVLGILVVVNILLSRFNARLDTTAAKQFSLAPQTTSVLQNLDKDINALGFFKSGEEMQAKELFIEYENISSRFNWKIVDPDKNPGMAKRYNIDTYGTIAVIGNAKQEKLEQATEQALTNAIIKVSRDEIKKIYFTTGHGEKDYDRSDQDGYSRARGVIEDENYQIDKILLASSENDSIPDDCSVLVIAGPKTDLFDTEKQQIKAYLDKGGKVLFMLDPESPPSFSRLLTEYGIDVADNTVIDASGLGQLFGAGPAIPIANDYADHTITKDFNVMTFFPFARSVSKMSEVPSGLTVTELAKTNQRSWGETGPLDAGPLSFDAGEDTKGPLPILTVAEKSSAASGAAKMRLAVFGDSDFAADGYFRNQGNGDLFMNTVSWLAEEEDLISVRARDPEDRRLTLTKKQSRLILYFGVVFLPVLIFIAGVWVYVKRK
jgi:ABC-type uncharacterized transport system involved in gliding motility auxiliary subunit